MPVISWPQISSTSPLSILFTHRILVRLLVLGAVRGVGEALVALKLLRVLARERFVSCVRPHVDLAVFQASERARAALELRTVKKKKSKKLKK